MIVRAYSQNASNQLHAIRLAKEFGFKLVDTKTGVPDRTTDWRTPVVQVFTNESANGECAEWFVNGLRSYDMEVTV
jgi:hypothetical protein